MSKGYRSKFEEAPTSQTKDSSSIKIMAVIHENPLNKIRICELRLIIHAYLKEKKKHFLAIVRQLINVEGMIKLWGVGGIAAITVIADPDKNH